MRGDFIIKFLEGFKDTIVDMGIAWSRVSYKGFRYSDFSIDGYDSRKRYVGFKNLERRHIIKKMNRDSFSFTEKGQLWLQNYFIKYFKNKTGKWDRKWRIIIFDIPQELHKERVKLRQRLRSLGFAALQKSVLVFPYPCEEEVGDVCDRLGVSDYVDVIVAESVGSQEKEMVRIFKL